MASVLPAAPWPLPVFGVQGGLARYSQRRAGSLHWSTKLIGGGWGSPGGARAGRASSPGSLCLAPSWCCQYLVQPCPWDSFTAHMRPILSSPSCGSISLGCELGWGGESPSPPLQFCSGGGCENWRDLSCELCSQCWGPGSCLRWALPTAAFAAPVLHLLGLPSSRAQVSPYPGGQTAVVVSLCLLAPLLSHGAQALLGSRPVPVPGGSVPVPASLLPVFPLFIADCVNKLMDFAKDDLGLFLLCPWGAAGAP